MADVELEPDVSTMHSHGATRETYSMIEVQQRPTDEKVMQALYERIIRLWKNGAMFSYDTRFISRALK